MIFPIQLTIYHYSQELSFVDHVNLTIVYANTTILIPPTILVNSMKLVFDQFKDNLLTPNYSFNLSSSLLTIILSWTMSLPEQKIFVSSAKRMNFNTGETLQMSLMYSINNFGPSIEPWGTPHITGLDFASTQSQMRLKL